nr:115_t:CDS:2 [Entrophospora candida]
MSLINLPLELQEEILKNVPIKDLYFKLRLTSKLFYNMIPLFIPNQLLINLSKHSKLLNYNKKVMIEKSKDLLLIKLVSKTPPHFEAFPWTIKLGICNTVDKEIKDIWKRRKK